MPTYCFKVEDTGEVVEEYITLEEMERRTEGGRITLADGRVAVRDYASELRPQKQIKGSWPLCSTAAAVHPEQIGEAMEHARSRGVPTDFDRSGRPILTSPAHRRAYLKSRGLHDRDSY